MKEIKQWTRDDLLLLLNLLSYGIDNELLPNLLEKHGFPKKDKISIWRDEKLLKAYDHYSNLIAKRLALEPMLSVPLMQMIDTALDGEDALILLHNIKINTEDDMREFRYRFNFLLSGLPLEDIQAGHDVPLQTFKNTQGILRSVTKKALKSVEDGQKPKFTAMETSYLDKAWFSNDPRTLDQHGPGTFYGTPGGFDREKGEIKGYVRDIEEFRELRKDLGNAPLGYRSPRQGNPGLITFGNAFWQLQEILQGTNDTKYKLCTIPDCGKLFVPSRKGGGSGKTRGKFCSTPCYDLHKKIYNQLYMKYIKRPKKKGEPGLSLDWIQQETLRRLSNAGESS